MTAPNLTIGHQLFLQALLCKPVQSDPELQELWRTCHHAANPASDENAVPSLDACLQKIQTCLDSLGYYIKRGKDHKTCQGFYVLVNTIADEYSQLATDYTASELALFRLVVDLIMEADEKQFAIPSLRIQQEGRNLHKNGQSAPLSNIQIQDTMDKLVRDQWLSVSRSGKYTLSIRSILELEGYLEERFAEHSDVLDHCERCQKLVTAGRRCSTDGCPATLHHFCADVLLKTTANTQSASGTIQCPQCQQSWLIDTMKAPQALRTVVEGESSRASRGRRSSSAKRKSVVDDDMLPVKEEPMDY